MSTQSASKFNPYNIVRGQAWTDDIGRPVRVMAFADHYVMARYEGRRPFLHEGQRFRQTFY
jgi:hypothetical protein